MPPFRLPARQLFSIVTLFMDGPVVPQLDTSTPQLWPPTDHRFLIATVAVARPCAFEECTRIPGNPPQPEKPEPLVLLSAIWYDDGLSVVIVTFCAPSM